MKAGDPKFVDLDGNGRIDDGEKTANNRGDMRVIGNSRPRYNYSGSINLGWNGFDISAFFQGVGRQHRYPDGNAMLFWGGYARPYSSFVPEHFLDDVWSEDNPDAYFPKLRGYAAQGDRHLAKVNNRYLQNTAYCRLKNLTVGYTLPVDLTRKPGSTACASISAVTIWSLGRLSKANTSTPNNSLPMVAPGSIRLPKHSLSVLILHSNNFHYLFS